MEPVTWLVSSINFFIFLKIHAGLEFYLFIFNPEQKDANSKNRIVITKLSTNIAGFPAICSHSFNF